MVVELTIGLLASMYLRGPLSHSWRLSSLPRLRSRDSFALSAERRLPIKGDFRRAGGFIRKKCQQCGWDLNMLLFPSRGSLALMRTADGSLVVRESEGGAGIMLIIPVAGYTRKWNIFAPRFSP
jgi:hypothetical protein